MNDKQGQVKETSTLWSIGYWSILRKILTYIYLKLLPCSFLHPIHPMSLVHDTKRKAALIVTFLHVFEKPFITSETHFGYFATCCSSCKVLTCRSNLSPSWEGTSRLSRLTLRCKQAYFGHEVECEHSSSYSPDTPVSHSLRVLPQGAAGYRQQSGSLKAPVPGYLKPQRVTPEK